jgi:NDP-sugar pyrophosphorylase family protein
LVGSKEIIPVAGRPIMNHLVERIRLVQPDSIRIVTRAAKSDVIANARRLDLDVVLADTVSTSHSIAVGISDLRSEDTVLIGFPDSTWEPLEGFEMLMSHLEPSVDAVLGLFTVREPQRADVVVLDSAARVTRILVKPTRAPSPLIWGCAVARRHALVGIESSVHPGEHFDQLGKKGLVLGVPLSDRFFDIGTPQAIEFLSLRRDNLWD